MTIAPTTTLRTASSSARELRFALSRYEALCSPPAHLLRPIVGDMAQLDKAIQRSLDRGLYSSVELWELRTAELRRIDILGDWRHGRCDRSGDAWAAIETRLRNAIAAAVSAGVIDGQRLVGCRDRLRDAAARRQVARRREGCV